MRNYLLTRGPGATSLTRTTIVITDQKGLIPTLEHQISKQIGSVYLVFKDA